MLNEFLYRAIFYSSCFIGIVLPQYAFAYRPFISTDASVAEKNKWEIEAGTSLDEKAKGREVMAPQITANYGIFKNWEIVGESQVQVYERGSDRNNELKDPALLVKTVVREGVLQEQQGPSLALESGILLPSTVKGEGRTGVSSVGILSNRIGDCLFHLNLGLESDRTGSGPDGIWGVITEYPFQGRFRLVGEINSTVENKGSPDTSGLIGFIWNIHGIDWDFGARKGFTDAALDWGLTTGVTFSF